MTDVSHIGASIGSFIPSRAERGPHSPSCVETPLRQSPSHTPTTKLGGGDGGDRSTFLSGGGSTKTAKREIRRLTLKIQAFIGETETLRKENEDLRSTHRTHAVALRQNKDAARRVYLITKTSNHVGELYEAELAAHASTSQDLRSSRQELRALSDENSTLRKECDAMRAHVDSSHRQVCTHVSDCVSY